MGVFRRNPKNNLRKKSYLSGMEKLSSEYISSLKSGLNLLTGYKRRCYAAELTEKYFDGSIYKAERYLGVGRVMVGLGLKERETGIRCIENFSARGRKKKKRSTKI